MKLSLIYITILLSLCVSVVQSNKIKCCSSVGQKCGRKRSCCQPLQCVTVGNSRRGTCQEQQNNVIIASINYVTPPPAATTPAPTITIQAPTTTAPVTLHQQSTPAKNGNCCTCATTTPAPAPITCGSGGCCNTPTLAPPPPTTTTTQVATTRKGQKLRIKPISEIIRGVVGNFIQ